MNMKIFHGSPGFGTKLSEEQISDFLANSKLNLRLGTIYSAGDPNIHPVQYFYEKGKLYVLSSKTSKKVQNIKNKNTVYFCVDDETPPPKGVRGKATVEILDNIQDILPIAEKLCLKNLGSVDNEIAKHFLDSVKNGFHILLEITPKYYSSWDHSTGFT